MTMEQIITRGTPPPRVHVRLPEEWNRSGGTDYWAVFGLESTVAAAASSALLSDSGWITTSLVETAGSAGDFLSSSDPGVPPHLLTDATGDLIQSPPMFGDYANSLIAANILGYTPTKLIVEFYAAFTVASANEHSVIGLVEAGGSVATGADSMLHVKSNGTNFLLAGAVDSDTGALVDTAWHTWKIVVTNTGSITDAAEWFIDGTSQGTMDIQADLWPCSFGMHALTTNRPALAWAHIWYE